MKTLCLAIIMILVLSTPLMAQEVGRYQAFKMGEGNVFIMDTKEGHMYSLVVVNNMMVLMYSGKVFPGKQMGEILTRSDSQKQK